jgi:3-dehydroquinate synthase
LAEALKMVVCLNPAAFTGFEKGAVMSPVVIRQARRLKAAVCAADPYEQTGERTVLNFGHTLGHVVEAASGFRVRHGEAVALGMLCALDVGQRLGVTPQKIATRLEAALDGLGAHRRRLRAVVQNVSTTKLRRLLEADKKVDVQGHLRMVLLAKVGAAHVKPVALAEVTALLLRWKKGLPP